MSTEQHNTVQSSEQPPTHSDVAFESSDIDTRTILAYLLCLALAVVAAFIASVFVFRFTTQVTVGPRSLPPPVRQGVGPTIPPEPRLQGLTMLGTQDPQQEMRNMIKDDRDANDKLGWIDKPAGIAQIPVEEAMKIIVSKGLPAVPASAAEKKK